MTRCLVTLASAQSHPVGLAVDGTSVYWTNESPAILRKVPLQGGTVVDVVTPSQIEGGFADDAHLTFGSLAVTNGFLFWWESTTDPQPSSGGDLEGATGAVSATVDGASPRLGVSSGSSSRLFASGGVAANANAAYFSLEDGFFIGPNPPVAGGGYAGMEIAGHPLSVAALAVDDAHLYTTGVMTSGAIERAASTPDQKFVTLTAVATNQGASAIAVDATTVYWTVQGTGEVRSIPKTGGTVTTVATGEMQPLGIAANATGVYWVSPLGELRGLAAGATAPRTISSNVAGATAMVADATSVYLTTYEASGAIMKFTPGPGCP